MIFSGSSYATSNLFFRDIFEIEQMLNAMIAEVAEKPGLSHMAFKMKEKFNKYRGDIDDFDDVLVLAAVLDPRYKTELVRHCFSLQNKPAYWIEDFCFKTTRMLKDWLQVYDPQAPSYKPTKSTRRTEVSKALPLKRPSYVMKEFGKGGDAQVERSDVDSYLADSVEPFTEDFDALIWWKCNCHR